MTLSSFPEPSSTSFVLASGSPSRARLLHESGLIPSAIWSPDVDETPLSTESPGPYVRRIARLKAKTAITHFPRTVILAADTTVAIGRRLFHKPTDAEDMRRMLTMYSGRRHRIYTHIIVCNAERVSEQTVITHVTYKRLTLQETDWYIASEQWVGKGGGLCLEGAAARFIKRINGSFSNCIGLPLYETINRLASFGVHPTSLAQNLL